MPFPNIDRLRYPRTLVYAALLLLFIAMAPVTAQAPVRIALLSVTVSDTGNVSWNSVPGISRYALGYFVGCRGPRVEWGASGINQFQVPDYDPALHLYFWIGGLWRN